VIDRLYVEAAEHAAVASTRMPRGILYRSFINGEMPRVNDRVNKTDD
jgi:hypothetical protein